MILFAIFAGMFSGQQFSQVLQVVVLLGTELGWVEPEIGDFNCLKPKRICNTSNFGVCNQDPYEDTLDPT